jgi:hypothetical protein
VKLGGEMIGCSTLPSSKGEKRERKKKERKEVLMGNIRNAQ